TLTEHLGSHQIITLEIEGLGKEIKVELPLEEKVMEGNRMFLGLEQDNIRLFHGGEAVEPGGE
ncbi:MAG: hypothetical protein ABEI54_04735, partial [Candidatus Bipolaricaulia bacterium]